MTDRELEALLADLESDRVERKASLSDKAKVYQAICAFANDLPDHRQPGYVVLGATDQGRPAGLRVTDDLLREVADMRDTGKLLPIPTMAVEKRVLLGAEMVVVEVQPSLYPPVRYDQVPWIRVGPRRARATPEEEQRLTERRRGRDLPRDLHPLSTATLADLDLALFRDVYLPSAVAPEVLAENRRTVEHQLCALRLADPEGLPTVTGVLALAREPDRFLPGAYAQFVRFGGTDLASPILDALAVRGPLPHLLRVLEDKLKVHILTAVDPVSGPTEQRHSSYPLVALQQIVRNGVLHRTYEYSHAPVNVYWFDDRVEIQSPGGAFGAVTAENFGQPGVHDYRNPNLAEAMRVYGYIQRFGIGLALARQALACNGSPPLEIAVEPTLVHVTIRKA
jgi:ATP-dependent DNA helicase RecG